jgi:hypothetical protein
MELWMVKRCWGLPKPAEFIQIGYPASLQGDRQRLVGVFPTLLSPGAICRLVQWGFFPARCCLLKDN